jgi:hypothetical protein
MVADPIIDPQYFSHPLNLEIYAHYFSFFSSLLTFLISINSCITAINKASGKHNPKHYFADLDVAKEYIKRTRANM